jgi:hypothetical protein
MAIVGDWVYWAHVLGRPTDGVAACPNTGCDAPLQAPAPVHCNLTTDGDHVYWITTDGWLNRWKPGASSAERLRAVSTPRDWWWHRIAVDGDYLYFTDFFDDGASGETAAWRVRKDGSEPAEVARGNDISSVSVTDEALYYTEHLLGGSIQSCPPSGCDGGSQALVPNQRWPFALQIAGTDAFWLTRIGAEGANELTVAMASCHLPDCATVKSWANSFRLPGLAPGADEAGLSERVVITSEFVLWREGNGAVDLSLDQHSAIRRLFR